MTVIKVLLLVVMLIPILLTTFHAAIVEIDNHNLDIYAKVFDAVCFLVIFIGASLGLFSDFILGGFMAFIVTKNVAKSLIRIRIG